MVMMGQYCMGDIPFRDVYIHAMIQDGLGRKMSKSLGNGIDPLVIIDSHGADAMRFTLASMTTDTQDIRMPVESVRLPDGRQVNTSPKFDIGRNFCNKLWNASRFAMLNLDGMDLAAFDKSQLEITDRWILSRLADTSRQVTEDLCAYRFNPPLVRLYKFFWNELCDWYLEWCKPRMADPQRRPIAQCVLAFVLDQSLRLLHPFLPFITEGIFQHLNRVCPQRSLPGLVELPGSAVLAVACWPSGLEHLLDPATEQAIGLIQEVTRVVREIRNARSVAPSRRLKVSVNIDQEMADILARNAALVAQLACLAELTAGPQIGKVATAAVGILDGAEVYVHDVVDLKQERNRLERQRQQIQSSIRSLQEKLSSDFASKARPEVVQQARTRLAQLEEQLAAVDRHLADLAGP
jgi:valyl-tRNA synthetase